MSCLRFGLESFELVRRTCTHLWRFSRFCIYRVLFKRDCIRCTRKPRFSLSAVKGNNSVLHSPFPPDISLKYLFNISFSYFEGWCICLRSLSMMAKKPTINTALMITCEILTCPMNCGIDQIIHVLLRMKMFSSKPILDAPADL